jgi:hypothetical protein
MHVDELVAFTVETLFVNTVLRPVGILDPATTYFALFVDPFLQICRSGGGSPPNGIRFTTGTGEDHKPPAFAGAKRAWVEFSPANSTSCGTFPETVRYMVEGDEDPDAIEYILFLGEEAVGFSSGSIISYEEEGHFSPSGVYPERCFVMRAMDQAGNIDSNKVEVCASRVLEDERAPDTGGCGCSQIEP